MANSAPYGNPFAPNFPGVNPMGPVATPKPQPAAKPTPPANQPSPFTGNPQQNAIAAGKPIQNPQPAHPGSIGGLLDKAGYLVVGEPFSKTNAAKLAAGKITPKQFAESPFQQHGQVNAGMPPFPLGTAGLLGKLRGPARSADETAQAVAEAQAAAKLEGFGKTKAAPHEPPVVAKGETTAATAGQIGADVRKAMRGGPTPGVQGAVKGVKSAYAAQEVLRAPARAEKANKAAAAIESTPGEAGFYAGRSALRGALPKLDWGNFQNFNQDALDAMWNHIAEHPDLRTFEKMNAWDGIKKAVNGGIPAPFEQKLIERAFGVETTQQIMDSIPFWKQARHLGLDALNIPRAMMSSADLSAPLRQGLVGLITHPVISAKNIPDMIKAFGSEAVFQGMMDAIHSDPGYALAEKAGLPMTEIGAKNQAVKLATREERFQSNLAEHLHEIPGVRRTPLKYPLGAVSKVIRMSDRAYVGYLDKTRLDIFNALVAQAARDGRDLHNEKLLRDIARFVGSATGRGPLGPFKRHAVTINALFFSPRLLASRLDILLAPATYLRADPFVRKQALQAMFSLVGTMSLVLELARLNGAHVGVDPTSADFAKIRIGNTRIDIAGGFQQPLRLAFELAEGKVTSSTTGQVEKLSGGIGKTSRGDVALRFLFSKAGPVPGLVLQASGVSQAAFGPKQSLQSMALQRLIPLLAQDANDLRTTPGAFGGSPGIGKAVAGYGLGLFGIGEQTYAAKQPKSGGGSAPYGNPFAGAGGGASSNPFGDTSGGGGSNPFG